MGNMIFERTDEDQMRALRELILQSEPCLKLGSQKAAVSLMSLAIEICASNTDDVFQGRLFYDDISNQIWAKIYEIMREKDDNNQQNI